MNGRFEPLVPCKGPHGHGCSDGSLVVPGAVCTFCRREEPRVNRRPSKKQRDLRKRHERKP